MRDTRPTHPPRLRLREVLARVGGLDAGAGEHVEDPRLSGLTVNSRTVRPGDLYVAPAGATTHGARFAGAAVAAGAVAILTDPEGAGMCRGLGVPVVVADRPRAVLGAVSALVYGSPAERLRLLAVTGTQGKTTTTRLAEGALSAAGVAAGVVGTVGTRVAGEDVASSLTTPEAPDLHALFAVMVEQGVRGCAMEVSSHALVMGRVDGVVFDVAAFTNLGRDHLDFHADVEDYFEAKASLFTPERARLGLVNVDDEHGRRLVERGAIPMRSFALDDTGADWTVAEVEETAGSSSFVVRGPGGALPRTTVNLAGRFNIANALCAVAGLVEAGFDGEQIVAALPAVAGVPGRLERVDAGQGFLALVDYAHKPDALEAVLGALRDRTSGRVLVVVGAGGDRDRGKRPIMGEVCARLADVVVVTDDNPRSEDPAAIRAEVLAGVAGAGADVHEVADRAEAIAAAVSLARDGDVVLVAGKGHETGQEVAGRVHPFDDREVLARALAARSSSAEGEAR